MSFKKIILTCGILGVLAVALGAFGAHGLKSVLPADKLTTYSTGITYHFYHTLGLLLIGILIKLNPLRWFRISAICFMVGILLFSGSLYLLATRELIGLTNYRWLGPITPIGGVFFILGWLSLVLGAININDEHAAN